jgi:HAD superfamily hydrolase (TIGR01450 family)
VLDGVRGFVFDVDGTLVQRGADHRARPQPGAVEVLDRIRASGRPLVLFTNGSHIPAAAIARGLSADGLPIADREMLTPIDSAITYLHRYHRDQPVLLFASDVVKESFTAAGIRLAEREDGGERDGGERAGGERGGGERGGGERGGLERAGAVLVTHVDEVEMSELDRAARAVSAGARLLTGSYVRGYAGANGMIFSRGAMITAAIAKVTAARPKVVGKPSRAAVAEISSRLGVPTRDVAVIGDDLGMDIALGRLGGSRTVLVRSGISGEITLDRIPARRRPDAVIDAVADLLQWL